MGLIRGLKHHFFVQKTQVRGELVAKFEQIKTETLKKRDRYLYK